MVGSFPTLGSLDFQFALDLTFITIHFTVHVGIVCYLCICRYICALFILLGSTYVVLSIVSIKLNCSVR